MTGSKTTYNITSNTENRSSIKQ